MGDPLGVDFLSVILNNPSIVAATISAVVAFAILGIDRFVLTPRANRRRYALTHLERRLDVYGHLVALLKGARKKGDALGEISAPTKARGYKHVLEIHDITALDRLFGEEARFFSNRILDSWLGILARDKYRILDSIREKREIGANAVRLVPEDLSEMQQIAESEFDEIFEQWQKLARIDLKSFHVALFRSEAEKTSQN